MVVLKTSLSLVRPLQTLGRIAQRCDGVCKMIGNAEHGGRLYLVMKLYGSSLEAHLRQTGPLEPRKVLEFGLQLAHTVRTRSKSSPPNPPAPRVKFRQCC